MKDMRDFRDAKAMAHSLRAALAAKDLKITVSQSLELIAEAFGVADWNTLSAAIRAEPAASTPPPPPPDEAVSATGRIGFSKDLEATLHRAIALAKARGQEYATLEHLLMALTDDPDARAVMTACAADPGQVKESLSGYVDRQPASLMTDDEGPGATATATATATAKPTAGFQRVVQRAVLHVQTSGRTAVTGAQLLVAIFSEQESHAARVLEGLGMTRVDAVNFMVHGIVKRGGAAA
jgi:hypothetical protein